ncbi:MAG: fatty acid desaturase [Alphaproteobacteria bacterium]|nr:fatty acid desaturase [Alphaproteobacteria bacterium]
MSVHIATTDPKWVPKERHSALEKLFLPFMRDERDLIFINVAALMTVTVLPMAIGMFFLPPWVIGLVALPYLGFVFLGFGGRYGLMLHATGHRPIFKREYMWMQSYIPFLGFFLGHTPTSFDAHHMWMHHAENNMLGDGSSTLPYVRDRFTHFLHYWARFFFFGYVHVPRYMLLRGRTRILKRFVAGELAWLAVALVALYLNWAAALVVLVIPLLMIRWLMMAGNWAQHAFIDMTDPDNGFKNSTCLTNTNYNHKCYNDGYHIVHHNKPGMHWTEMAKAFEDNVQDYIDADSLVFDGLMDNQQIWFLLMTRNYDKLARHMRNFHNRTHEQKVEYLKTRVRTQMGPIPSFFHIETPEDAKRTDRHLSISVEEALVLE